MSGPVVILMGVSGAGKTTVGRRLAGRMGCEFHDSDELHRAENVRKMASGIALSDEDRWPWLDGVRELILDHERGGTAAVIACSALKESYRRRLLEGTRRTRIVYLEGAQALIEQRLRQRRGHFFDPELLSSQFEALEEPADAVVVDVEASVEAILEEILAALAIPKRARGDERGR